MMKSINRKMRGLFVAAALLCAAAAMGATPADAESDDAPGWDALNHRAQSAALERYSTEALEARVEKKQERLDALSSERSELRTVLIGILSATEESLDKIDGIDDPVLRDESLLRFRDARDTRMKSVQARLTAVEDEMLREQQELGVLRQLLQGRRVEASLHGIDTGTKEADSYNTYLAREAERVRSNDRGMLSRVHEHRINRLREVILPVASEARLPNPATAVLLSNRE